MLLRSTGCLLAAGVYAATLVQGATLQEQALSQGATLQDVIMDNDGRHPSPLTDLPALALDRVLANLNDPQDLLAIRRGSRALLAAYEDHRESRQLALVASGQQSWYDAATIVLHRSSGSSAEGKPLSMGSASTQRMSAESASEQLTFIVRHADWTALEWQRIILKAEQLGQQSALAQLRAAVPSAIREDVFSVVDNKSELATHRKALFTAVIDRSQRLSRELLCSTPCIDMINHIGSTVLELAASLPVYPRQLQNAYARVKLLMECGADPRMPGRWGTSIHAAASMANEHIVRLLLDFAPDLVHARSSDSMTALHVAVEADNESVVRLLLERGANVQAREHIFWTMPHFFAMSAEVVELLLDAGAPLEARDKSGRTALISHIRADRTNVVRTLLARGADAGCKSLQGQTPLHAAVGVGNNAMVRLLLAQKAVVDTIDMRDNDDLTPLHNAVRYDMAAVVRSLLRSGASVTARTPRGHTAFLLAVRYGTGLHTVVDLLSSGSDVNACDNQKRHALHLAAARKHLSSLLVVNYILGMIGGHGFNINELRDIHGRTPLFYARSPAMVRRLLEAGADPRVRDSTVDGWTPLHVYSQRDQNPAAALLLLQHGAELDARTYKRELTPLHVALLNERREIVAMLVNRGSQANAGDAQPRLEHTVPEEYVMTFAPRRRSLLRRFVGLSR